MAVYTHKHFDTITPQLFTNQVMWVRWIYFCPLKRRNTCRAPIMKTLNSNGFKSISNVFTSVGSFIPHFNSYLIYSSSSWHIFFGVRIFDLFWCFSTLLNLIIFLFLMGYINIIGLILLNIDFIILSLFDLTTKRSLYLNMYMSINW